MRLLCRFLFLSMALSAAVWCGWVTLNAAEPCVRLFASGLDEEIVAAFHARLPSASLGKPAEAPVDAQVLLLGERDTDAGDDMIATALDEAQRRRLEVLWFSWPASSEAEDAANAATAERMRRAGVMTVDFAAFSRSLRPKDAATDTPLDAKARHRQGEFLAEAVTQWWAACATTNPATQHIKLWPGRPPSYDYTGPERVNRSARIDRVAEPELVRFLPKKRDRAPAVIFFPGGGYGYLGFLRNARDLADRLDPLGIAIIGLKYRTGRPVEVPLLDAERAVRYVRAHAAEWGIDPARIGVAGQSAGANLVLNLAGSFDEGDPESTDPVERLGSRPDFMIVLTSWNFGKSHSTFTFPADMPPVFLRHSKNDSGFGIAEQVVAQIKERGTPLDYRFLDKGGHGAFELSPGNPGSGWPDDLVSWLRRPGLFDPVVR